MDTLFCEVIGCGKQAAWRLQRPEELLPDELLLEEHICDDHRKDLSDLHPDLACRYVPLALITQ